MKKPPSFLSESGHIAPHSSYMPTFLRCFPKSKPSLNPKKEAPKNKSVTTEMSVPETRPKLLPFFFLSLIYTVHSIDELQILLNFKSRLSNPDTLQSWQPNLRHCNFTGITCNPTKSVTEINLTNQKLSGLLPLESICTLQSLQKLTIGSNSLIGTLDHLPNCTQLVHLDLASNYLTGPVPDLSSLSKLQVLNLSNNGFSGPFPSNSIRNSKNLISLSIGDNPFDVSPFPIEVLEFQKLSLLYLSNSNIRGEIPPSIGNLTDLVNLELAQNHITGRIPPEIAKLTKLWQLQLWQNRLTGPLPSGLRNLTGLRFFDVSVNLLDGDLTELKFLNKLVSLQICDNRFSGEVPIELGDFRDLVNFSVYSNNLSGILPQKLGSWSAFDFIDATGNFFTGPIPPDMCKQGKMKLLLMLDNMFSGEFPATYANCFSLTRLRVTNNSLSGRFPDGIWGLPLIEMIDLANNRFDGPVSSDIGKAINLLQINLANNRFSGALPPEITNVVDLVLIDIRFNEFSGEIPARIGELMRLNSLFFQGNKLSGAIPETLGLCNSLNDINLAGNSLVGQIPASLGSLPSLNSLNLSGNQLSGQIPSSLSSLKLSLLDLSDNRLSGSVPYSLSIEAYNDSFAGNPDLCSQNFRYLRPCSSDSSKSKDIKTLISCFLAGTALLLVTFGGYLIIRRRRIDRDRPSKDSWDMRSFSILSFTEQEVLNSIKQENLIGKGGSGNVYRVVLGNGKSLAVKHIWTSDSGSDVRKSSTAMLTRRASNLPEFNAEVAALSSIRHVNVVKLYCSITSEDSSLLVYDYLPNGSLWDRLHTCQKMELDWGTRYEIAVGSAKGLEYLHHGCERAVIHRDVKSSNILLDEFFKPRIADFGLAKIVQATGANDSTRVIAGTHGYIAPEYAYTYKVNEKSDVYSFGVVLMELVTGKRPIEPEFGENKDIVYWVSSRMTSWAAMIHLVDPRIPDSMKEDVVKVLRIAILCTARLPALRPSMRTVVQLLEDAEPCKYIAISGENDKKGEDCLELSKAHGPI